MIQAFDVTGVSHLSNDEVERVVYAHTGPGRTKADVEAARKGLQDAYAAKGYGAVVVEVPVQDNALFAQGIVQIAVSEVPVGQFRVTGSRHHAPEVAREQVRSIKVGEPLDLKTLQSEIAQASHFPDMQISPQFKPGKVQGEIDVDLNVSDEVPWHASVELNNDYSPTTKPLRTTANVRYTNLFQTGQSASLTLITAPQKIKQTIVVAGSYTIPILNSPLQLAISGYDSNSNVASLGGTDVLGVGWQAGVRLLYRLPVSSGSQSFSIGADFKDFKQRILVNGAQASSAPITYLPIEAQYAISGATEHSSYDASLTVTAGLRAFHQIVCIAQSNGSCLVADAFQNRGQYAYENFLRANLAANFSYAFKNDFVAALRLAGQAADSHLVTNEQFSGGGTSTVRGYLTSEAVGDEGIEPSLELRGPSLAGLFGHWLTEARFYVFADGALLHVQNALAGQVTTYHLLGMGGGLKLRLFNHFSGDVLIAEPMTEGPTTMRYHPRVNFQVKGDF